VAKRIRLSAEGPQMAIAQIEVQVKRNPMKTVAQIINRVNNLSLDVSSDPEVYHRRTSSERRFRSGQPQAAVEAVRLRKSPRYLALSKFEVFYESPKRERVSQGIQGWDTVLPHRSRLTFQYLDRSRQ
jgi:hypothetical protein